MNVDEVLKYEAVRPLKESLKTRENDYEEEPFKKKSRKSAPVPTDLSTLNDQEKLQILKMLENEPEGEIFNEQQLKKLLNQLEKKVSKNQEMRIKFPEQPDKFMDSELELNDVIQEMHVLSTRPDLYPILFDSNCVQLLLGLLSHENIDICSAVVSLLQELTDLETSTDEQEQVKSLIDMLCDQQIFSLLVSNLERFDEKNKDEAEAVHNALAIVENIIEVKPFLALDSTKQSLFQWLLKRIKVKGTFDNNKLYCAELLSILVQNQDENRKLLCDYDGIDISDEFEYMENLFNCLCSCLMLSANRTKFLKGEGLQLMRLILREQKHARNSALKVLSYAMNNLEGKESCQAFVDILGLAVLFPLFMKPIKINRKKKGTDYNNEEHIVSIIASLLKNCTGTSKQRVVQKFTENDYEKVDRLLELYFKYSEEVARIDQEIDDEREDDEEDEETEAENYLRRLENGLFALQSISYIILDICANGPNGVKNRVMKLLNLRNVPKTKIIEVIKEYERNLGDEGGQNAVFQEEHERIKEVVEKF